MNNIRTHIMGMILVTLAVLVSGVQFYYSNDLGKADNFDVDTSITNIWPIITETPSDGSSDTATPTNVGANVTFTAIAEDANSDNYYLAICKTDAVSAGDNTYPTCTGGKWPNANPTAFSSTAQATETYTALVGDSETNAWYAFACDKVSGGGTCSPINSFGDQGRAVNGITIASLPEDGDTIIVDTVTYEFDRTNGSTCSGGEDECVDISDASTATDAALALYNAQNGLNSHMYQFGAELSVHADAAGTAGNSIAMSEPDANEGGSANNITLGGGTLIGGSDSNASPFQVNHAPAITTVTIGDTSGGGGLNPATGTVEVDDTVYFNINVTETDSTGTQDTVDMFVCETSGFTYGASPACTGTEICNVTGVNPATTYAECNDSGNPQVPMGTSTGSQSAYVYIQDSHDFAGTGTNLRNYTLQNSPPSFAYGSSERWDSSSYTGGAIWSEITSPVDRGLEAIDFIGSDGWAAGHVGKMIKTTDFGASWVAQTSNTTNPLKGIDFYDADYGWAVGTFDTLIRTVNGGTTWTVESTGTSTDHFYGVHFITNSIGWISDDDGDIRKTTDGGTNWTLQTSGTANALYDLQMLDANTGYAVGGGGTIRKTTNGGANWNGLTSGVTEYLTSIHCISTTVCWAAGESGVIIKTTNGTSWSTQTTPYSDVLESIHFSDVSNGWSAGTNSRFIMTTNGGTTWSNANASYSYHTWAVHALGAGSVVAVGDKEFPTDALILRLYSYEDESSSTIPTNAGEDVEFLAIANDPDVNNYYLAVCKTNAVSAGAPPTCTGGAWGVSELAANGLATSSSYTTSGSDAESNIWYAFVCDISDCSTVSQGSGNSGTPFVVNHAPTFGAVTTTDTNDGDINPGDSLRFTLPYTAGCDELDPICDEDTVGGQDLVNMYICTDATTSFNYATNACTGGALICSDGAVWGNAELIETDNTGSTGSAHIAIDSSGNAITVWNQSDGTRNNIWSNQYTFSTGLWGTAELIETENLGHAYVPKIVIDGSGNAIAVWYQHDGTRYSIWSNRYTFSTGLWGTAEKIETDDTGNANAPKIAIDSAGNAIAVWYQTDGIRNNIWSNRYTFGTGLWGTAELIETDNLGNASFPQIGIDGSGNGIAVWHQSDGIRTNIWSNRYTFGTGLWGTAELIETNNAGSAYQNSNSTGIPIDSSGNAIVVWYQSDGTRDNIWSNRYTSGVGWGTAELIETNNAGGASLSNVDADSSGNGIAVWHQSDGTRNNIWSNRYASGVGWGTAELIETDNAGIAEYSQVVMDSSGNGIAVWRQNDGTRYNALSNRYTSGVGWGTAELIEADNAGDAYDPRIVMDSSGNAITVWSQDDGTRLNQLSNRYSADGVDPTSEDATCDEVGNTLVPPSDTSGSESFKVYVEDGHDFAGTGTNAQSYTIANTAPTHDDPELDIHAATLPNSVAYWQFEDGLSATAFDDETSNENDGACSGTCPTWDESGYVGGAYNFDGGDYITVPDHSSLRFEDNNFTMELWVYPTSLDGNDQAGHVRAISSSDFPTGPWWSIAFATSGAITFDMNEGSSYGSGSGSTSSNSGLISTDNWHHVAVVVDRVNFETSYYVNGVFDSTKTINAAFDGNLSPKPLYIGGDWNRFKGLIDETHIYNRALTADEIAQIYSAQVGAPETNLVSHWSFNNGPDGYTQAVDYNIHSGNWDDIDAMSATVIKDGNIYKMWYVGNDSLNVGRFLYSTSPDGESWSVPVSALDINQEGNWDINNVHDPTVIKDGDIYKMWFAGATGSTHRILYTTSTDGVSWITPVQALDIGAEGTYDTVDIRDPFVLKDGSTYKIWYSGTNGSNRRILYATSTDGINWNTPQMVLSVGVEGTWDAVNISSPTVIKDGSTYKMWYAGRDVSSVFRVLYTNSTDGINWSTPVRALDIGQEGAWDTSYVSSPSVIKDGNAYKIWYTGSVSNLLRIIYTKINYMDEFGGNDGVWSNGTPTALVTGYYGKAVDLNGTSDYIDAGNIFTTNQTEMTVSAWVNVDTFNTHPSTNIATPLVSNWNVWDVGGQEGYLLKGYFIYVDGNPANDLAYWSMSVGDGVSQTGCASTSIPYTTFNSMYSGAWHHLTGVFDGGNFLKLYLDGNEICSIAMSATHMDPDTASKDWIGRTGINPGYLDGSIDEVRIYDVALSATEVQQLHYASKYHDSNQDLSCKVGNLDDHDSDSMTTIFNWEKDGTSTTVLNMPFDSEITSTAADAVVDYSGNGNHGTLAASTATPTWTSSGKKGGAYDFDGTDDYIDAGNIFTTNQTELTVSTWVNVDIFNDHPSTTISTPLVSNWNVWASGSQEGYLLRAYFSYIDGNPANDLLNWQFAIADGTDYTGCQNTADLSYTAFNSAYAGAWHNLVGVFDGGNYIKVYLNGSEIGSCTTSIPAQMDPDTTSKDWIGRSGMNTGYLNGKIDEVQIYDSALSAEQIFQNYNNGNPIYNTIVNQETDEADVSWMCKAIVNDASDDSSPADSNLISPNNSAPVQSFPLSRAHALLDANSVGYWQFEGGDLSANILDETTNSNDGSCTNCPTWTAEGAIGGGYDFDGVDSYIEVADSASLDISGSTVSVSAWINPESTQNGQVIMKSNTVTTDIPYGFQIYEDGNIYIQATTTGGTGWQELGIGSYTPGVWQHVTLTYDGITLRGYINGSQTNSNPHTGTVITNNDPLWIGGEAGGWAFDGLIDEPHIYDRALSTTEIANLYNSTSYVYGTMDLGTSGRDINDADDDSLFTTVDWRESDVSMAVLNMSFNEDIISTTTDAVTDYSTYTNHGTLGAGTAVAAPTWTNATTCGNNSGGCYDFDGTDDYIETGLNLSSDSSHPVTLEAWVNTTDSAGTDPIIGHSTEGRIDMWRISNDLRCQGYKTSSYTATGTTDINDGNWHHVVCVFDENGVTAYVDGNEEDNHSSSTDAGSYPMYIGETGSAVPSGLFDGMIDEVKIYNRALTLEQIQANFNAGNPNYQNIAYGTTSVGESWRSLTTFTEGNSESSITLESNEVEILGFSVDITEKWDDTTYNDFWHTESSGLATQLSEVFFINSNVGWLRGGTGGIRKTVDGGLIWTDQISVIGAPNKFYFHDINTGWVVGANDGIAYTTNGGDTWTAQTSSTSGVHLQGVHFVDDQIGYIVGNSGTILKTVNGGTTWTAQSTVADLSTKTLYDVTCYDSDTCWAVGANGTVVYTADGGSTAWVSQTPYPTQYYYEISCVDANNCWAVGANGGLTHTSNGGTNWSAQSSGLVPSNTTLDDVHFFDTNNGWIVAHGGNILRTTNGGTNWNVETNDVGTSILIALHCIDVNNCWAVGNDGVLLKGGWQIESSDTKSTHVGEDVLFKGNFNTSGADYYLAICKTNEVTAGNNTAPTCNSVPNTWAISSATTDSTEATATYTTSSGDAEQNTWYAFACTKEVGGGSCSPSSQGSGDSGSPFVVNHAPAIGTVTIYETCDTTDSVDPGNSSDATVIEATGSGSDYARDVVVQSDGKVVMAGYIHNGIDYDFAVIRYHADGTLDTSFDTNGIAITPIGSAGDLAFAVAVQDDGKIVAVGRSYGASNDDFAVVRYNTDGSLDTDFDGDSGTGNGKVVTPIGSSTDFAETVAIQSDGKILVGGSASGASNDDFVLVRYNTDGTLDTDFDGDSGTSNGKVFTTIGTGNDVGKSLVLQPDGKIVLAGHYNNGSNYDFAVVRYNTDGTLDTDFDTDGRVLTPIGAGNEFANDVAIQSDGKIVVAGYSNNGSNDDFAVVRYNTNGSLDADFDGDSGTGNGKVTTAISSGSDAAEGVAIQTDGKIVLAGYGTVTNNDFIIVRYNTDGTLDIDFDGDSGTGNGKVTTPIGGSNDYAHEVALMSDGKIVAAGHSFTATNDFAWVRYDTDGTVDDLSGYVCVSAGVTDSNTSDTIDVHVCSTDSFTGGTCDGTTYCTITGATSGDDAQCVADGLVPIPTAHGSANVYVFAVDSNGLPDAEVSHTESYSVTDTAPYILNAVDYTANLLTPTAGTTTAYNFTVIVKDDNGDTDITGASGAIYDSASTSLTSGTCSDSELNCYTDATCTLSNNTSGTDNTATVQCDYSVVFNANASSSWKAHVNPSDEQGSITNQTDSNTFQVQDLEALNIIETSIAYSNVALGRSSDGQTVVIENLGNKPIDITVEGDDMCTDSPGCVGNTILSTQQKYHSTNASFPWGAEGSALINTSMSCTPSVDCNETHGCVNRSIGVRPVSGTGSTDESIYWRVFIPVDQTPGVYSGQTTIGATASDSCIGTEY